MTIEQAYKTIIHTNTTKQYVELVKVFALNLEDDEWEAADSESRTLILYGDPAQKVADAAYLEGFAVRGITEIIEVSEGLGA